MHLLEDYLTPASPLCSVTARENVLIFGTESGHLVGFDLPSVGHTGNRQLPFKPARLALNSNATYDSSFLTGNVFQYMKTWCFFSPGNWPSWTLTVSCACFNWITKDPLSPSAKY